MRRSYLGVGHKHKLSAVGVCPLSRVCREEDGLLTGIEPKPDISSAKRKDKVLIFLFLFHEMCAAGIVLSAPTFFITGCHQLYSSAFRVTGSVVAPV